MKISYGKEKSQNIRVLIATIKVRMNYDNAKMAKCLGLKLSTYQSRVHLLDLLEEYSSLKMLL